MNRRRNQLRERKQSQKNAVKRSDQKLYRTYIVFSIIGIVNWLVWYRQYLDRGFAYDFVFNYIPLTLGLVFFYFKFKVFCDYYLDTKTIKDKILTTSFLFVMGLMISFMSFGTLSNVVFKSLMAFSLKDQTEQVQRYKIVKFTSLSSSGRARMDRFSSVQYEYSEKEFKNFNLDNYSFNDKVNASIGELKKLNGAELKKMNLILHLKEGFWGIKEITDFEIK